MEINYNYKLTREEHVLLNEELNKKRNNIQYWASQIFLVLFGILFLLTIMGARAMEKPDYFLPILFLICFILIFLFPKFRAYSNGKIYDSNVTGKSNLFYRIDNEKIQLKSNLTESEIRWKAIQKIYNLKNYYLLMPNKFNFHIIPKAELNQSQEKWLNEKFVSLNLIKK